MEHKLPEISAASIADRQHPSSGSSVPMTAVGEYELSLIICVLLALLLSEQCLKTCPYHPPHPKRARHLVLLSC